MGRAQSKTEKAAGVHVDTTESKPVRPTSKRKTGEALKAETEAMLDEIDEVLQENAEEFVQNYVQRGGQ
jgi:ubiquitin-like protein Pup